MLENLFVDTYLRDLLAFELTEGLYIENFERLVELKLYSFVLISSCGQLANKPNKKPGRFCDLNKLRQCKVNSIIDCKGDNCAEHYLELSLGDFDEHWQQHFYSKVENIIAGLDLKFIILAEVNCEALKSQHGLEVARYLWVKGHEGFCTRRKNVGSDDNLLSS